MPVVFQMFVNRNHHKFPLVIQVQEGIYGCNELDSEVQDFSSGDYLQLLRLVHEVNVTFESFYDGPSRQGQITMPVDYDRMLEVYSRYPDGHVFLTAADVLTDCVLYVYPKIQFDVQGVTVEPGDRLKVIRRAVLPKGEYLLCNLVRMNRNLMIPYDTKGEFVKKGTLTTCRLSDIIDRLPQRVRVLKDESMRIRGMGHGIEGLPEDYYGDLLLSKVEFVEARLWNSPEKIIKIPCSTNIYVEPTDKFESQFGNVCDIHIMMARNILGNVSKLVIADGDEKKVDKLGLTMDAVFKINGQQQRNAVLVKCGEVPLLLPINFKGLFELQDVVFQTAADLHESNYIEKVRVTRAYRATDPRDDSLYHHDEVQIHCKQMLTVRKEIGTGYEEHEQVLLDRTFSNEGPVGLVKVPTYANAHFTPSVSTVKEYPLTKILELQLPVTVSYVGFTVSSQQQATDDYNLQKGQRVTVYGVHSFNEIYISPDDEKGNPNVPVKAIPDYVPLNIRPLRPDVPGSEASMHNTFSPPRNKIVRLDDDHFDNILKEIEIQTTAPIYVEADQSRRRPSRPLPKAPESDYKSFTDRPLPKPSPTVDEASESRFLTENARYQARSMSSPSIDSNPISKSSASSQNSMLPSNLQDSGSRPSKEQQGKHSGVANVKKSSRRIPFWSWKKTKTKSDAFS